MKIQEPIQKKAAGSCPLGSSRQAPLKKVLFLIESLEGGGAEKVLVTLLRHLGPCETTVCTIQDRGVYVPEVRTLADHYKALVPDIGTLCGLRRWLAKKKRLIIQRWLPARWVYRLFVKGPFDVEIAFLEGTATRLIAASPNPSKKYAWIHTDLVNMPSLDRFFPSRKAAAQALQRFDHVVGVSEKTSASVRQLYGCRHVVTLYNPIDEQEIRQKAELPVPLPEKKAAFRLVSVGRLTPQKGFVRLIRLIAQLRNEGISVELWLVGEGSQRAELEQEIRDQGLEEWVTLWGFQNNPYPWMKAADLYVGSSFVEGYSLVIIEALVLRIPVVLTRTLSPEEMRRKYAACRVTDNSDQALYHEIRTLLTSPEELSRLRQQVNEYAEHYSIRDDISPINSLLLGH